MSNQIANLYNTVPASVAATRDTLGERLRKVRETASLLYNRMMRNIEYGQEGWKGNIEKETRQEEEGP